MARFCSLLSGGKDSNYALYRALSEGMKPSCILSLKPERRDSWMFHTAALDAPRFQAGAMGLQHVFVERPVSGVKEKEVEELGSILEELYRERGFDVIVVGGIASEYQKSRVERIASRLGVSVYSPQWGVDPVEYMYRLVEEGLKFIIVRVSTMGLNRSHLGVIVDKSLVDEIVDRARRYGFHPAFEGGEAETLVLHAPHYKRALCIEASLREEPGGVSELLPRAIELCSRPKVSFAMT